MKLDADVLKVLGRSRVEGAQLFLPEQLERKLYLRTDEALRALGGTWSRKAKAHVFQADPRDAVAAALDKGAVTTARDLGFFPTPAPLARRLVALAGVRPGDLAVEPSAGEGAIVAELIAAGAEVHAVEVDPGRALRLREKFPKLDVLARDWLDTHVAVVCGRAPRAIVMKPPFSLEGQREADVAHVTHALETVAPGGNVVAVMSAGVTFRQTQASRVLRGTVEAMGGSFEELPEGTFRESGTDVRAVILTVRGVR